MSRARAWVTITAVVAASAVGVAQHGLQATSSPPRVALASVAAETRSDTVVPVVEAFDAEHDDDPGLPRPRGEEPR